MKQKPTEIHKYYNVFKDELKTSVVQQYLPIAKQWKFFGYRCLHCDSPFKSVKKIEQHKTTCKEINTIKKDKEMLIQTIMVDGVRKYRMGDKGRAYDTKAEAENSGKSKKKVGADGKVCWDGYRYGGTVNGKDICTKMKKD